MVADDDAPRSNRFFQLLPEKLDIFRSGRATAKRLREAAGDGLRINHDDIHERRLQGVAACRKLPRGKTIAFFQLRLRIGRTTSDHLIVVLLRIAIIVIAQNGVDRNL